MRGTGLGGGARGWGEDKNADLVARQPHQAQVCGRPPRGAPPRLRTSGLVGSVVRDGRWVFPEDLAFHPSPRRAEERRKGRSRLPASWLPGPGGKEVGGALRVPRLRWGPEKRGRPGHRANQELGRGETRSCGGGEGRLRMHRAVAGEGIPDLGMGTGRGVGRHPVSLPVWVPLCPLPLRPEALLWLQRSRRRG